MRPPDLLQQLLDLLDSPQHARLLRLSYPNDDPPAARLLVNRFKGFEALSRDFRYELELLSDDASIELDTLQGKLLCISLVLGDGSLRPFTGHVAEFGLQRTDGGVAFYRAVLVPWFEFLRLRHNSRLFHGQTLQEQAQTLFGGYGALPKWAWAVQGEEPRATMATQWDESDHNYLSRRLEAAGHSYRYDHSERGHTWQVASSTLEAPPIEGPTPAVRFQSAGGAEDEDAIAHWSPRRTWAPGQVAASGFDFKNPTPVQAEVPSRHPQGQIPALEVHRYQGHYGFKDLTGAEQLARLQMAEIEARIGQYDARGNNRQIAAGRWFALSDHFQHTGAAAEFLVLEVEHEASNNYLQAKGQAAGYSNRFRCQPRAIPWHPGRNFNSTETRLLALQTATVVGPPGGGSLHVDRYGRIRVRFHWDRQETASCWVRVSSQWAGGENGMASHPRVGSEVVVQWLDGNPDHPLVTGCVHNERQMPPWQLPQQQALTGLRSRELTAAGGNAPGGRSNHLLLDDTAGRIQAQLSSDHLASQLSLGHIARIDDTAGRKDERGQGMELRTDGHGAVRAERGLLLTTEARPGAQAHITDMGETVQRLGQSQQQHEALAAAASQAGAVEPGDREAVGKALQAQARELQGAGGAGGAGGVGGVGGVGGAAGGDAHTRRFPEFQAPHLTLASPAGIQTTTAGSTHLASDAHTALTSGQHTSISAGASLLVTVKEAVRLFAYKAGMRLVAAAGDIDLTALKHSVHLLAKLDITQTANRITITAKEEVVINGGTSFSKWNASGIEHGTHGVWREQAAAFSLVGPANAPGPKLAPIDVVLKERPPEGQIVFSLQPVPGPSPALFAGQPYTLLKNGAEVKKGLLDAYGRMTVERAEKGARYQVRLFNGTVHDLPVASDRLQVDPLQPDHAEHQLSNKGYRADGQASQKRVSQSERGAQTP